MERLDKIISATGKKSRREVKLLVKQGRILVDGVPASAPEMKVDPAVSEILLEGHPSRGPPARHHHHHPLPRGRRLHQQAHRGPGR